MKLERYNVKGRRRWSVETHAAVDRAIAVAIVAIVAIVAAVLGLPGLPDGVAEALRAVSE